MLKRERFEGWLEIESRRPFRWLALFGLLLACQITPDWLPTPDATAYLSIARSIATHHALRMLGYEHAPYPPGYPLLISPAFLTGPLPFLLISIIQWVMATVFMAGLYRWMIRQSAPGPALLLTGLVMVNVTFWFYFRRTLSEVAFMAVAIWAVLILDRALASASPHRVTNGVCGALLLVLLTTIRETGALFGAALIIAVYFQVRRQKLSLATGLCIAAGVFLPALAGAAGFIIYDQITYAHQHVFGTHLSGLLDPRESFSHRMADGIRLQICATGRLVIPGMFRSYGQGWLNIDTFIYCIAFALLSLGWWRLVRQRYELYALLLPLYLAVYAVWDFNADTRYLLPVLPVLVMAFWYLIEPYRKFRFELLAIILVVQLAVSIGYWAVLDIPQGRNCNRQWNTITQLANSVQNRPGIIAASALVPKCVRLMLSLRLDRPVDDLLRVPSSLSHANWLLTTSGAPPPAGFSIASIKGNYALLVRDRPVAAAR